MKQKELAQFADLIAEVKEEWKASCIEQYNAHGDRGSCVMGAGIVANVVPPRCRNPRKVMLISQHEVAQCQGSLHFEHNVQQFVQKLKDAGIPAYFDCGWMD